MPQPWPFPQDTAIDRARSIARSFASALREVAPAKALELERTAREFGEGWLTGAPDLSEVGELVDEKELARRLGVRETTVRDWVSRGVGPGASRGEGRKLTRYPGGYDPVEAEELRRWARTQRGG